MSILVATDLSDNSRQAVRWASALAALRNVPLLVVHVIETIGDDELWTALFETPEEIEERVLRRGTEKVRDFVGDTLAGVTEPDRTKLLVAVGAVPEEIDRFATHFGADLVVSGTTGHGFIRNALFGSTARRLVHSTSRPTAFIPPDAALPPAKRIVVGIDFSPCSDAALRWTATHAAQWGSKVIAVHGLGVSALSPDYEPSANFVPMVDAIVEQREADVRRHLDAVEIEGDIIIERAGPAESIIEAARDRRADLLVLGTHGRGALGRLVLGSVASRVLRHPPCATIVVHQDKA